MYDETVEHSLARGRQFQRYKSESKQEEYAKKLNKLSFQLKAEMEFLAGEQTFRHATQVEENLNMDEVYDALDSFGSASKLAFEFQDIEMEAKCEAMIGKIYDKALRKDSKAMTHYKNVVRLCESLRPRNLTQEPWYRETKRAADAIEEKRSRETEAAQNEADKPFIAKVKADLDKVRAEGKKDCVTFLKFINEKYTPEAKRLTLTDDMVTEDKLKRLMKVKFSPVYHPDKNVNEPREIQILREEIMRFINIFLEEFK